MKRVLITGGAGFIGSHLCERLLGDGCDVICLDNYFTGSKDNVRHLLDNHNFELVRHDVTEPFYAEVDEIYNLACPASPVHYQYNPIKTMKTSFYGAMNMLGLAKRTKAKILQASTSEVYGDPAVHPQQEGYWGNVNPIGLRSCYDEGKRASETLFMDYHRQNGVRIKITIYGDGMQTRSFQYVDDLVEAMVRMMATGDDFTGPVNTGNPGEFTMLELAEKVISMTGSKSKLVFMPLPSDDPKQRKPDISLAYEKLGGWQPSIKLEDGLAKTIAYFKDILD